MKKVSILVFDTDANAASQFAHLSKQLPAEDTVISVTGDMREFDALLITQRWNKVLVNFSCRHFWRISPSGIRRFVTRTVSILPKRCVLAGTAADAAMTALLEPTGVMIIQKTYDIEQISEVFDLPPLKKVSVCTIGDVQEFIAAQHKLTVEELVSLSRKKKIIIARHIAMYLCIRLSANSLKSIGHAFNKKDHSMAISSRNRIQDLMSGDAAFKQLVLQLERTLRTRT